MSRSNPERERPGGAISPHLDRVGALLRSSRYTPGVRVLLVSTYELGHQPLSVATAAASLTRGGHEVRCADVAVESLDVRDVDWAEKVALSVPMHTAMRLAREVAGSIRQRRPGMPLCFFGLYAGTAKDLVRDSPGDAVIAGEYEPGLTSWAGGGDPGPQVTLKRTDGILPLRSYLPPLESYARFVVGEKEGLVGSVTASRGCSHRCRHCPVPVVYDGRVRPVAAQVVLEDVDNLVAAGASHISFSDPDFLNVPGHSRRVINAFHERHPHVSFDVTIKVEHILRHRSLLAELAVAGCSFVVSAFESTSDRILRILDKGHTAGDASEAVVALRQCGIEVRPSWLPFTPWTTVSDLVDLFDFVVAHDLVANVDPVQYTIRLLLPEGSLLVARPEMTPHLRGYDPVQLGWTWTHPDPGVEHLHKLMAHEVEASLGEPAEDTFERIESVVRAGDGSRRKRPKRGCVSQGPAGDRPRLSETWFCCSEPTQSQLAAVGNACGSPRGLDEASVPPGSALHAAANSTERVICETQPSACP